MVIYDTLYALPHPFWVLDLEPPACPASPAGCRVVLSQRNPQCLQLFLLPDTVSNIASKFRMISSSVCFCRQLRQELLTLQCTTVTLFSIVRVTTLSYRIVTQYKKLLFCKQRLRFANEVLSKVLHRTVRLPSTPAAANKNTLEMIDHHEILKNYFRSV